MASKKRRKFHTCPNCAYQFQGVDNFCPNCGQENHNLNVPLKHLFLEFLEGTLHFDTKFFHTIKLLLRHPGRLTERFAQNKRADYVPPIRLYVFISFIFFLVLATDALHTEEKSSVKATVTTSGVRKTATDPDPELNLSDRAQSARVATLYNDRQLDSLLRATTELPQNAFTRRGLRQAAKFLSYSPEEQSHRFYKNISLLMFVFMPFFGLILKLAYFRQHRHYIQHLIFSIHFHCFLFLLFTVVTLLNALLHTEFLEPLAVLISVAYFFLALYYFYRQSRARTVFKGVVILVIYSFTLVLLAATAGILSILL